jgi:hypothetical protein
MKAKSRRVPRSDRELESLLRRAARILGLVASPRVQKAARKKPASAA